MNAIEALNSIETLDALEVGVNSIKSIKTADAIESLNTAETLDSLEVSSGTIKSLDTIKSLKSLKLWVTSMNSIDRCLSELSSVALLLIITSAVATALAGVRALRLGRIRRLLRGRVRSLSAISRLVIRLGISDLGTVITVRSMSVLLRRV